LLKIYERYNAVVFTQFQLIHVKFSNTSFFIQCLWRWRAPARGNSQFMGGGTLPRVEIRNLWAVERYRAWDSAISERWNVAARGILHFLSGGTLPRVGFCDF